MGLSDTDTNNYKVILEYKNSLSSQNASVKPEADITRLQGNCNTNGNVVNQLHQKQKRLNDKESAQMIAAYKAGASMRELARQFGCHRTTISNRLKCDAIRLHGVPASKEQVNRMVPLYESGLSLVDVGEQVGVSANTVLRYLKKLGINIRRDY